MPRGPHFEGQAWLGSLLRTLRFGRVTTEAEIGAMAAAQWALGHAASSDAGLALLPPNTIASLVKLAEECPVLSLRGTHIASLSP